MLFSPLLDAEQQGFQAEDKVHVEARNLVFGRVRSEAWPAFTTACAARQLAMHDLRLKNVEQATENTNEEFIRSFLIPVLCCLFHIPD
jgi:hypothetical protein